jgi:predicted metalloprotease
MARWDSIGSSGDVEDRRGMGSTALFAGGGGIVALLITIGLNFLGLNIPQSTVEQVLNTVSSLNAGPADPSMQPAEFRGEDSYEVFTQKVLGSTNDVWDGVFTKNNITYQHPKLVLFRDATQSGCGVATSDVGPHFCPNDGTIYLDETFFDELKSRFGANTGEVAQAYVIAHEVGPNVQNQLGAFSDPGSMSQSQSIEIELQADCYAGVWAFAEAKNGVFEGNEIDQALSAAAAVGDDNIQSKTSGQVNPETWTHGSSAERVGAFKIGYQTGEPAKCVNLQG